jgi:pimeloyl-ACP methyl ester carboxylesterase
MSYVTVGRENSAAIRIYYEDRGEGAPVLVHGYLLDGHSWERQEMALLAAGYRVITYDRRGFGASSRPSVGYNYDTLAADLAVLPDQLDLREVVLAGFCAGTGEVTRYLGTYGHGRVRAAVLLAPLPPFLPRAGTTPAGLTAASSALSSPGSVPTARPRPRRSWTCPTTLTCSAGSGSAIRRGRTASMSPSGHPRWPCQAALPRGWKIFAATCTWRVQSTCGYPVGAPARQHGGKQPPSQEVKGIAAMDTRPNIVLVHGAWADGATTIEVPSSHVAMVSHPAEVTQLITAAAETCAATAA